MGSIWEGKRVRLRAVAPGDADVLRTFDEDTDDLRRRWYVEPPRSAEAYDRWAIEIGKRTDPDNFSLTIESVETGEAAGKLIVHHASQVNGTFQFGINIGQTYRRRGYASEAIVLTVGYMFLERRYQKCNIEVLSFNDESVSLHTSLGFVEEGRRRRERYTNGSYHDMILLGITCEEFLQKHCGVAET